MNLIVFDASEWGNPLPADDERAVHIREVLRLATGDSLRVGLLGTGAGTAIYRGVADGQLRLDFPPLLELAPDAGPLPLTVFLGQPRPPVMQRLLKDLGALGVARVLVVASDLSEKSYMQSRLWQGHTAAGAGLASAAESGQVSEPASVPGTTSSRGAMPAQASPVEGDGPWRRQLIAGAQQGGHCFLTAVERFYSVNRAIEALDSPPWPVRADTDRRLVLDLGECASFLARCAGLVPADRGVASGVASGAAEGWCLAIGPERGWSDRERAMFRERGFSIFSLGSRILRTETATILATGMLALALGDRS